MRPTRAPLDGDSSALRFRETRRVGWIWVNLFVRHRLKRVTN
jgi:hypothetical protein